MAALLRQRPPGKHRQAPAERAPSPEVVFFADLLEQLAHELLAFSTVPELDMPTGQLWPGQDGA